MSYPQPTLGVEIESNWPNLSAAWNKAFMGFNPSKTLRDLIQAQWGITLPPVTSKQSVADDMGHAARLDLFRQLYGANTSDKAIRAPFGQALWTEYQAQFPKNLRVPEGIFKASDGSCGMELKFDKPAKSLDEAKALVTAMCRWMKDIGVDSFNSAGMHVHIGYVPTLKKITGEESESATLFCRAEAMLAAAIATRERAIYGLIPSHRCGGYSAPTFFNRFSYGHVFADTEATSSAVHNHILALVSTYLTQNPSLSTASHYRHYSIFTNSGIYVRRRYPTIECRYFPGTHSVPAATGYLRLIHDIVKRTLTAMEDTKALGSQVSSASSPIVVNPHTFTVSDLLAETEDKWLKKWITATNDSRNHYPITTEIPEEEDTQRQPVAA